MERKINIFIVDDHRLFKDGLKSLLSIDNEINILGEASNGKELLKKLEDQAPDVILLDINMPEMDGVEVLRILAKSHAQIRLCIISTHDDARLVREIWKLGAQGYILKSSSSDEELIRAIKIIHEGGTYYSKEINEKLRKLSNGPGNSPESVLPISITKREIEILKLVAMEYTSKEIAKELFISTNTVETHKKNLFRKLNVKSVAGLTKYALKHDLI